MTRESYRAKGMRYVTEGRLTVTHIGADVVTATVKGAGEIYTVTADADFWNCSCPAKGPCAHIHAAQLVVLKPKRATP